MRNRVILVTILAVSAFAQSESEWLNQGIQLFKSAKYRDAVEAFEHAASLNPSAIQPHLYLGTALLTQWIPGADSPENGDLARRATAEFETVLRLDPRNQSALASLGSLTFNESRGAAEASRKDRLLDQAAEWYRKLIEVEPRAKDAYYSVGVIAWSKCYPALMTARQQMGMKPEDPGPLSSSFVRQDLTARFGPIIEDGIQNLQKALEIDPSYSDAMAYLNLLIRERADLRDSPEEYRQDVQTADSWVQKALQARRSGTGTGSGFLAAAPPPPPPPPPPPSRDADAPQRIRVSGNVQESNIITKVDPVYPPLARQARVQGSVQFQIVIGKDGRVQSAQLISGHPILVVAATDAIKQWVYRPTLLNGQPVEVVSQPTITFSLAQ